MTSDLTILGKNRDAILLAEVGVRLHMLGKYEEEFVKNSGKYNYKEFYKNLHDGKSLKELLTNKWPQKILKINELTELRDAPEFLGQFMSKHTDHNTKKNLLRILVDAHGRGSGTEKGILNDESYDNQGKTEKNTSVHLATAFGYESEPINLGELSKRKNSLYKFLESRLSYLKDSLNPDSIWLIDDWIRWRQPFIDRLRKDFGTTVGDTRRPVNDVTLWDQTAATVAFFKVELAEVLLSGWKDPLATKFNYRLLRVAFDAESFISQSPRIGDILARKQLIENAFNGIRDLIEVVYPIGLEIYRETGKILFLVPNLEILDLKDENNKSLRQLTEERFEEKFKGEVTPDISLSEKGSRNVFYIREEIQKPTSTLSPTLPFLKNSWNIKVDRCTVCQVRPQGYGADLVEAYKEKSSYYSWKAAKRKICCICMNRLRGRSENWVKKNLDTTIWIDEVADINGKVALIIAQLDLEHWLSGEFVSTFRNPKDSCGVSFNEIKDEMDTGDSTKLKDLPKLNEIGRRYVIKDLESISGLKSFLIRDEDLGENEFSSIPENEKLSLAVWRKPPSFARIRRVWETTYNFWKNVEEYLDHSISRVESRLIITGDYELGNIGGYHSYTVELKKGVETNLLYDSENNCFILIENLSYLAKRLGICEDEKRLSTEEAAEAIKSFVEKKNSLDLYEDVVETGKSVATISNLKVDKEEHNFLPVIPILSDPDPKQFIVIVPANKALKVSRQIVEGYETQYSKVRNRLPIHLNVVVFNRKQPLYAALDAGRRMLNRKTSPKTLWEIKSIKEENHSRELVIEREDGEKINKTCELSMSYSLGDPDKEDVWHPYLFAESKAPESQDFSQRNYYFRAPLPVEDVYEMKDAIHVKDLEEGDKIYCSPSTFDFEFLDVTTRRYELCYNGEERIPRKRGSCPSRAFLLEDLYTMDKLWKTLSLLTSAQINQLIGLMMDWRERWQITRFDEPTYRAFSEYALKRSFGNKWDDISDENKEFLIDWACNGRLIYVLELYMKIPKFKPKGDVKMKNMEGA